MRLSKRYKENWDETRERFERWWKCRPTDRPLMRVNAPRDKPLGQSSRPEEPPPPAKYLDADYLIRRQRFVLEHNWYGSDAIPLADANLGPGSLALYLGSQPGFAERTVWFEPCIASLTETPLPEFDPRNRWLATHLRLISAVRDALAPDAYTTIPDIVESLDILAAMRGPTQLLYDLSDEPRECHRWLQRINSLFAPCYEAFYSLLKDDDGGSVFTAFNIWGPGRTCKIQCDFSAMISPDAFREFFAAYAKEQIKGLDRVLYHLDGPSCIRHLDALLELERLHAIQWIPGAGQPDAGDERWYPVCRRILDGGKALHVAMPIQKVAPFIREFGARGVYILTSAPSEREAAELLQRATQAP